MDKGIGVQWIDINGWLLIIEYYGLCSIWSVLHVIVPLILIKLHYVSTIITPIFQMGEMEGQRGYITDPELQN